MKKILLIFSVFLIALVVAIWFGRPVYHRYKERRFLEQAQLFLQKEEYSKASLSARQALQVNATNIQATKIMGDLAEKSNSPQTLAWRKRLVELEPSADNQLTLAGAALRFEPFPHPTTAKILAQLSETAKQKATYQLLTAELAMKSNNPVTAESHYQLAIQLDPKNESAQLNLAALQLESRDAAISKNARERLEGFRAHPQLGLRALRFLVESAMKRKDWKMAEDYSQQTLDNSHAIFFDRVVHLTILREAKKDNAFQSFLKTVKTEAAKNPENIYKLSSWLTVSGLADTALSWINSLPAAMQLEQPVPVAKADCYAAKNDWNTLESFLREGQWGNKEFIRLAYLTRALKKGNENETAQVNWRKAMRLASEQLDMALLLVKLAESWGWTTETEILLWMMADKFPAEHWPLDSLHRSYYAQGNSVGLHKIYSSLSKNNREDAFLKNNLALVSLLLKTNLAEAHNLALQAYKTNPRDNNFISTSAWSLHLQGKTADALKLFEPLSPAELEIPGTALYYGALLAEVGEKEKARKFLQLAASAPMLPEEKIIWQQAKTKSE